MLEDQSGLTYLPQSAAAAIRRGQAYYIEGEDRLAPVVIAVDHATNFIPQEMDALGVSQTDLMRHIAWDIGAAGVASALGRALDAPVIGSCFSRLIIDPNRDEVDPTLVMRLYDRTIIPGNHHLRHVQIRHRIEQYWRPYHDALARLLTNQGDDDVAVIAIHSFTPALAGKAIRPWHIGILHADDDRLSAPLIASLNRVEDWVVGDNEPYSGRLPGDTLDRHALQRGRRHVLIELRQDLIASDIGQILWAEHLTPHLEMALLSTK